MLSLSATAANGSLREAPRRSPLQKLPRQPQTHCRELTFWQVLRKNRTLKHNPMTKSTSTEIVRTRQLT